MSALVLLSGGLDSTTVLAQAMEEHYHGVGLPVHALSIRYGSRHDLAEWEAARAVAEWYRIPHHTIRLPSDAFVGSGSTLMGEGDIPHASYQEIHDAEGPSPTVVPFRNAVLLSLAVAFAASNGLGAVYAGMHAEDAHNWAYPDCTPEFLGPFTAAVYVGTYRRVRLVTPFIWIDKAAIVRRALELKAPLHLTWSCYDPKPGRIPCGLCPTCVERIHAFEAAGYLDPAPYRITLSLKGVKLWPTLR